MALGGAVVLQLASMTDAQAENFCTNCNVRPLDHDHKAKPLRQYKGCHCSKSRYTTTAEFRTPSARWSALNSAFRVRLASPADFCGPEPPPLPPPPPLLTPCRISSSAVPYKSVVNLHAAVSTVFPHHSKLRHVRCACDQLQSTAGVTLYIAIDPHENAIITTAHLHGQLISECDPNDNHSAPSRRGFPCHSQDDNHCTPP